MALDVWVALVVLCGSLGALAAVPYFCRPKEK